MERPTKVTTQDVLEAVNSVPPGFARASLTVAGCSRVISAFLGDEWIAQHVTSGRPGFFELDLSDQATIRSRVRGMGKVRELAELMMNLQSVEGFHHRVRELLTADETKLESTFAELQIAGLMHQHELMFRFLPEGQDFEAYVDDGLAIRIEAKCKLEGTEVRALSVFNSLRQAGKQVPGDGPATLFIKIPQSWHESGKLVPEELASATYRFFGMSKRVISVVYYSTFFDHEKGIVSHSDAWEEVENHKSRFRNLAPKLLRDRGHTNPNWINLPYLIHGRRAFATK